MKFVAAAVVAICVTGCASAPPYTQRAMGLSIDMTKDQVISKMGPPRKTSARKTPDGSISERYFWWSPAMVGFHTIDNEFISQDRVFVSFVDGRVTEWGDKYDFSASMDKALEVRAARAKAAASAASN